MHRFLPPLLLALSLLPLGGQDEAPSRPGYFTRNLYPVLEKAGCRGCHNVDGVSSATRLHFPEEGASPARIEAFGKSLVALVDRDHPGQSLLLNKPTLRIPHTGGKRIPPGTPDEKVLQAWVDYLAKVLHGENAQPHPDEKHDPVLSSLASIERELVDLRERVDRIEQQLAGDGERP